MERYSGMRSVGVSLLLWIYDGLYFEMESGVWR